MELKRPQINIMTPRLILRKACQGDAEALHACLSDGEVMKYGSFLPYTRVSQTARYLEDMMGGDSNGTTDFVICIRPDLRAIGKIGILSGTEIGFLLSQEHWRRGIMSEALQTLLPYYFNIVGYARITADVDPRNTASLRLLAKFGFVVTGSQERTVLLGTEWADSVYLELTKEKWLQPTL